VIIVSDYLLMKQQPIITLVLAISLLLPIWSCFAQQSTNDVGTLIHYELDTTVRLQTIHNFGASDAWSMQFVGKYWPLEARETISDLLFSTENDTEGNPRGIGLSAWRFNLGAGSAEQGAASQITDEWRRSECFIAEDKTYDWSKQAGQQWFLQAAQQRGVTDFIGFVNSPPVAFTKNGKAWSANGRSANLMETHYNDYAAFLAKAIQGIARNTGVHLDYISPFNEPQWEWECCKQEGSPWNNYEIARATRAINAALSAAALTEVKIELPETAQIDYLFADKSPRNRDRQLSAFFDPHSSYYLGNLEHIAPKIAGHSYFSTWDDTRLVASRQQLRDSIQALDPSLEYWMTEYCLLEDNPRINGAGRDLGIAPALYLARVVQADLLYAHASAWHWWLAVSPYDYKDGLVYIDKNQSGGRIYPSKMLWALGHFSRFIRPGAVRIQLSNQNASAKTGIMASAFQNQSGTIVLVFLNEKAEAQTVGVSGIPAGYTSTQTYLTSAASADNLRYVGVVAPDQIRLPGQSILTCVLK